MAKPILKINGHDYTDYVESMEPTVNALDAEGSGRDVQTGQMFRTMVAKKQSWSVTMTRMPALLQKQLIADIMSSEFYNATILDPTTGAQAVKTVYTSSTPCGSMRYIRDAGDVVYDGVAFSMIER